MIINNLQEFFKSIPQSSRLLGIDFGQKKLGFAISNIERTMTLPVKQIIEPRIKIRLSEINNLIVEFDIKAIVIGLPLHMDGKRGEQAEIVQKFAELISKNFDLPIYLQDERFTSKAASNALKSAGFTRRERDSMDDQIAACMILETTLIKLQRIASQNL